MKCPYRISEHKRIVRGFSSEIHISERTEFEECYGENCPLYDEDIGCIRVQNEGGEV